MSRHGRKKLTRIIVEIAVRRDCLINNLLLHRFFFLVCESTKREARRKQIRSFFFFFLQRSELGNATRSVRVSEVVQSSHRKSILSDTDLMFRLPRFVPFHCLKFGSLKEKN